MEAAIAPPCPEEALHECNGTKLERPQLIHQDLASNWAKKKSLLDWKPQVLPRDLHPGVPSWFSPEEAATVVAEGMKFPNSLKTENEDSTVTNKSGQDEHSCASSPVIVCLGERSPSGLCPGTAPKSIREAVMGK